MRKVIILVLLAVLAGHWYFYGRKAGNKDGLPDNGSPAVRQLTLKPTYAVDLESGSVDVANRNKRDLWWEIRTATEQCLCPFAPGKAALAEISEKDYLLMGAEGLAELDYSRKGFRHSKLIKAVHPGLTLAVHTDEGNFAKVKVRDMMMDNRLVIKWHLFHAGEIAGPLDKIKTLFRTAGYYLSALSMPAIIFLIFFTLIAGFIAFVMIFGKSTSSRGYWDSLIKFAINNNATNLLVEKDRKVRMKIEGEWQDMGFPVSAEDIDRLKSFLGKDPNDWTVRRVGLAHVIRNEDDAVEWELKAGPY